jgi:hypothetical protein
VAVALPKRVPLRREQTGVPGLDRIQQLTRQAVTAQEQTKAAVLDLQTNPLRGLATIVMADQDQVITAAQLQMSILRTTGVLTANRKLTGFPRPTSDAAVYSRVVWQSATGGFSVSVVDSGGASVAIGTSAAAGDLIVFLTTGPIFLSLL